MRNGFSDKELQRILGYRHASKVSQGMSPAVEKIARCWLVDPDRTIRMVQAVADQLSIQHPELGTYPSALSTVH